jgi:outer membrane protein assembly factor BamB
MLIVLSALNGAELWRTVATSTAASADRFSLYGGGNAPYVGITRPGTEHQVSVHHARSGKLVVQSFQPPCAAYGLGKESWELCETGSVWLLPDPTMAGGNGVSQSQIHRISKTVEMVACNRSSVPRWQFSTKTGDNFAALCTNQSRSEIYALADDGRIHVLSPKGNVLRAFVAGLDTDTGAGTIHISSPGKSKLLSQRSNQEQPLHLHAAQNRLFIGGVKRLQHAALDARTGCVAWDLRRGSIADKLSENTRLLYTSGKVAVFESQPRSHHQNAFNPQAQATEEIHVYGVSVSTGERIWDLESTSKDGSTWDPCRLQRVSTEHTCSCPILIAGDSNVIVTKYAKGGYIRYHIRCFGKPAHGRSIRPHHEAWHYPPGAAENGWTKRISCLAATKDTVFSGSTDGIIYAVNLRTGALVASIDELHVDPVTAMVISNGMLWSASTQLSVLRLQPLEWFGVIAGIVAGEDDDLAQMQRTLPRLGAYYVSTIQFFQTALFLVLDYAQFLEFSTVHATTVASQDMGKSIAWASTFGVDISSFELFTSMVVLMAVRLHARKSRIRDRQGAW